MACSTLATLVNLIVEDIAVIRDVHPPDSILMVVAIITME